MDCKKACCTIIKKPIYTIVYNKRKNIKSYFVFIGENNKLDIFNKIKEKNKIIKKDLELLKTNFPNYYKIWISIK